ncbi:MAG: sporulation protein YqfD [Alistipes sp.]|nr:sporulation protein YqfD [Alistipes sp.]
MTKILSFFKGILTVKLISSTPERFLNICNANHIKMWDLVYVDEYYYFKTEPSEYYRLKGILKKTGSKTAICEKKGLPFLLFRYRKHNCFAAGILLAVFLLYLISLFVWDISVEGNRMITDEVLLDTLYESGVRHGMLLKKISCDNLEKMLRNTFDDLTWVSVEINGTRLIIHVKENDEDYIAQKSTGNGNLVALKDGTVQSIITRSGTPLVTVGDEVAAGDVLVSGIVDVTDDYGTVISQKYVSADADIVIRTVYDYEDILPKTYRYRIFTGKNNKMLYVKIFDCIVKLGFSPGYEKYETLLADTQIKVNDNFYLPVHYGLVTNTEYQEETAQYTEQEARTILEKDLEYFLAGLEEKGVQILEKNVKMYKNNREYVYRGEILVQESAYTREEIIIPQSDAGENDERD